MLEDVGTICRAQRVDQRENVKRGFRQLRRADPLEWADKTRFRVGPSPDGSCVNCFVTGEYSSGDTRLECAASFDAEERSFATQPTRQRGDERRVTPQLPFERLFQGVTGRSRRSAHYSVHRRRCQVVVAFRRLKY